MAVYPPRILDQLITKTPYLWTLRDHAVGSARFNLQSLAELDDRLEGSVDCLTQVHPDELTGTGKIEAGTPGGLFILLLLAVRRRSRTEILELFDQSASKPELARACVSAIGWQSPEEGRALALRMLRTGNSDAMLLAGLRAAAAIRADPGPFLEEALAHPDPNFASWAGYAVGRLARVDLAYRLVNQLSHADTSVRFEAAQASYLIAADKRAMPTMLEIAKSGEPPYAEEAAWLAAVRLPEREAFDLISVLSIDAASFRAGIRAASGFGDARVLPWLIEVMRVPGLSRLAGEAFGDLTGIDYQLEHLEDNSELITAGMPTADKDSSVVLMPYDSELASPQVEQLTNWWTVNGSRFEMGSLYCGGQQRNESSIRRALIEGNQRRRRQAALMLAMMKPSASLFEWRSPGFVQRQLLGV